MSKVAHLAIALSLCAFGLNADSSLAPALQWVTTLGGSGANQVNAAAADAKGNLYIVGTTSAVDLQVTSGAAQSIAGGSTLVRINASTNSAEKLYPTGLSGLNSLAVDPRNSQTIFAAAGNSVWRSSDGGTTFTSLTALPAAATARSVAIDPFDSNTIYAATSPLGVFKSVDGGLTWTAINTGIPQARDGSTNAYRVWTDPKNPQVVFASGDKGLLRSANGGASWTVTISSDIITSSLAFDPQSPGTLYVASPTGLVISKSVDDGKSFTPLPSLPDQSAAFALLVDPFHSSVLYAGSYSGIYQSSDGGATWTRKTIGPVLVMTADPIRPVLYAAFNSGIIRSADGFSTSAPIGPPVTSLLQLIVAGPSVFAVSSPSTDAFVAKLDSAGNVVYSTYFGGSSNDSATAMALGSDGSAYVTGKTASVDFPVTAGVFAPVAPKSPTFPSSNFVFKLNPDGSLAWSTYFADGNTAVAAIAVDAAGNPYIAGASNGSLPTTPGAYQTQFRQIFVGCGIAPCIPGPPAAFVTKFDSNGAKLVYSTYVSVSHSAQALVVDAKGNAYFGGGPNVTALNAAGSDLLASTGKNAVDIAALALDAQGNLYATGRTVFTGAGVTFPATPGAFQTSPQPASPNLPAQLGPGGGSDAFVMEWDAALSRILAATLLGGEMTDSGESISVDSTGNIIVAGTTDSKAFPTRAPFQTSFSPRAGFVAGLDSSLSHLLFSTYLGDGRPFDAHAAFPDGSGNILLAGSTLTASSLFLGGQPGGSFTIGSLVVANKISLPPAPAPRLDSVVNFANHLANALAPEEAIQAIGSGLGPDAQLLIDGTPLPGVSGTASSLVAVMPDSAKISGTFAVQVVAGGASSNTVLMPAAPASPGVYSTDGSGYGQGYILNSDGTLNSPANPAAPGSAITIFATGAGQVTLSGVFAVTPLTPAVFVDGFYAFGIAATIGPVTGLPGNVYQLGVYVPDPAKFADINPNLLNFKMPPQVGVKLIFGAVSSLNADNSAIISQNGVVLNVKQ